MEGPIDPVRAPDVSIDAARQLGLAYRIVFVASGERRARLVLCLGCTRGAHGGSAPVIAEGSAHLRRGVCGCACHFTHLARERGIIP